MVNNKNGEPIRCAVVVGLKSTNSSDGEYWEVLMEQRQVKNWLKSTPNRTVLMAWPGEYAFPGGANEPSDKNMEETAKRELQEELLGVYIAPHDFHARLFDVIFVPGLRRNYKVYIYIAFAHANQWLNALQVKRLNENLERRMGEFQLLLGTGEYWKLTEQHKMYVSPEVHKFVWMPLREAVAIATNPYIEHVNEFQRGEFLKHKVQKRDPVGAQMIEVLKELLAELEPMAAQQQQQQQQQLQQQRRHGQLRAQEEVRIRRMAAPPPVYIEPTQQPMPRDYLL
eukprot:CAMPEP_0185268200 /NCGR_PEP_ID=MMETSP1359-20130426/36486_1 /TAXON_ID=552665 /ORGANISM="Bigelowiella longifila, Strain CCMP242" /LENGTH=282 /DNA_ID=CAMNT_0027858881 /DNA_START=414 /DNA_END=1262 /DNA_ORIENTATION=-